MVDEWCCEKIQFCDQQTPQNRVERSWHVIDPKVCSLSHADWQFSYESAKSWLCWAKCHQRACNRRTSSRHGFSVDGDQCARSPKQDGDSSRKVKDRSRETLEQGAGRPSKAKTLREIFSDAQIRLEAQRKHACWPTKSYAAFWNKLSWHECLRQQGIIGVSYVQELQIFRGQVLLGWQK